NDEENLSDDKLDMLEEWVKNWEEDE
ncbi:transcriptional regulator, partial [Clostridioides difficile]